MDAQSIVLKLIVPFVATVIPLKMAKVDFRAHIRAEVISVHRGSPSFAAWEDATQTIPALVISATAQQEPLRSGRQLKDWIKLAEKKVEITKPEIRAIAAIDEAQIFTFENIAKNLVLAELEKKNASGAGNWIKPPHKLPSQRSSEGRTPTRTLAANVPKNLGQDNYLIAGNIEFHNGAALLGSGDRVFATYQRDGRVVNEGQVDMANGTYQVASDGLDGVVVAEIRSADGGLLGRGEVGLLDRSANIMNADKPKSVDIKISPASNSFIGKIVSATQSTKEPLKAGRIFVEGIDRAVTFNATTKDWRDTTIASASQFMFRAEEADHRASVAWGEAGRVELARLYPDSYVRALLDLSLGKYRAREHQNSPILWGRVLMSGYPVEGATVSLVGEDERPVYFTGFVPDLKREKTSKSGEFAFAGIDRGEKIIEAEITGLKIWPAMLPAYDRAVTLSDLEISPLRSVEFKSYDAFSLEPLPAVFAPVGGKEERVVGVSGAEAHKIQTVRGLTFIEGTSSGDYLPIRTLVKQDQYEVHLPQVKTEWLKKMAKFKNIPEDKLKNAVIGFVEGDDFEVVFGSGGSPVDNQIAYFDIAGEPVSNLGPAGGGFIIFDAPKGLQTVTLLPSRGKTVLTQTVYLDELATHVLRTQLTL